jgi:hypothetical protein
MKHLAFLFFISSLLTLALTQEHFGGEGGHREGPPGGHHDGPREAHPDCPGLQIDYYHQKLLNLYDF